MTSRSRHLERGGALHDVIVRDDDPVARPDEARAKRLRGEGAIAAAEETEWIEERIDLPAADCRFGLNVHYSREHVVGHDDDGRPPRAGDRGRNRRALLARLAIGGLRFR